MVYKPGMALSKFPLRLQPADFRSPGDALLHLGAGGI